MSISSRSRSLTKGLTAGLAALVIMGGMVSTASAGSIIFQDNFNRGQGYFKYSSTVGNGWYETEKSYNDVAISYNHLQLRDSLSGLPDAAASRWINTSGYQNISLMYDFKPLSASDYSDKLYVDFRTLGNNSWTNIASHSLGGNSWTWNTASLNSYANNTKLQLRFWTDVTDSSSGNYEGVYIDNVQLMGDAIAAPAAVPEPSTMALFATGMVGMGLWRARKNKKEQDASIE
ncbi:MAG: hypothetical protein NPIRA04_36250 [Nitrospirales bacterium]|nr:MAG: hypothetical protein NPIRA04_36250 [Nitrospirales bacterium]